MHKIRNILPALLAVTLLVANISLAAVPVSAAPLTNTYLRLNRMSAGATTSARLVFTAASSGATSVSINMNGADSTTWTGSSGAVNTTQTVSSAACATEASATALPGSLTAAGSGSTVTISNVTALTAGTKYCVDLTSASAFTVATAGEYHPVITAGSDSVTVAVRTVTNDQIVVTATVPPTFNFVLSGNTDSFTSNLSAGSVGATTGVTATVNTNAKSGWVAWARDSNTGLNSVTASKTIASTTPGTSTTLTAGSEGYAFGIANITQGSGTGVTSANGAYDATSGAHGSGLDGSLRTIASSTGNASNAVLTLRERATISALTTAASDYTDTITVIGAGNF